MKLVQTKTLTLKYYNSWQEPADFEVLSSCLAEDFRIDAGFFVFNSKKQFVEFLKSNPTPWKEVKLISSIFSEDVTAIMYEGINTTTNKKMRVSEHIQFSNKKIVEIYAVITQIV